MIVGKNLKKSFGGKAVLSGADFVIPDRMTVGLYGPSGIGKSTLAKLLCGVLRPDEGSILLDGELLVSSARAYDRRKGLTIQMVYQQPYSSLDPSQKLIRGFRELIRYHRFAKSAAEEAELLNRLMAEVGLDMGILQHLPRQISGGEAQRVAIARCLLFHPRLLILDEATSMLDVSTQANVIALVRQAMEESGGSLLLISHDRAHIVFRHILPNLYDILISRFLLGINSCIMMESTLSFLGFGDLYHPTWGTMINFAYKRGAFMRQAYAYLLSPGVCIMLLSLSFYFISLFFEARRETIREA